MLKSDLVKRRSSASQRAAREAFTLIELLVVMAVIGILISLLLSALAGVRERTRAGQCQNRLTNIHKAMLGFEADTGNKVNPAGWAAQIMPNLENNATAFHCPSVEDPATNSYGMNNHGNWLNKGTKILIVETELNEIDICSPPANALIDRHNGVLNVVFADGSVRPHEIEDIDPTVSSILDEFWMPERLGKTFCP